MKRLYSPGIFLGAVLFCASPAHAAISIKASSIDMGGTGRIVKAQIIENFSTSQLLDGWFTTGLGYANMFAPVGQFTGYRDDGTPLSYLDLIPLTTSSVHVVGESGETILYSSGDGTTLSGKVTLTEPQGDISMGIYQ